MKKLFTLAVAVLVSVGMAWAETITFAGNNLDVTSPQTVGDITLSVPSTNGFTWSSNKLYASGGGKTFALTAANAGTISQVLITMDGTSNRFTNTNITNCTSCTRNGSIYTCTFSTPQSTINFKNNGGGVGITKLEVTYTAGSSDPVCPAGLSISGTKAYTVDDNISLTASLTAGNGEITYQWYKGGTEEANKIDGATSKTFSVTKCQLSDAGDYYCVASKADCDDVANAEAYSITVEAAKTIDDLVTIDTDFVFTPTATIAAGKMSADEKFFAAGSSDCDYDKGMRVKENRALAFKVLNGAKVVVTFTEKSDDSTPRKMKLGTAMTSDDSQIYGISGTSPATFNVTADGIVYLTATSDLRFSKLEVLYARTVTYSIGDGTGTLPTEENHFAGEKFTLHDGTTGITAPEGKEFEKWVDQDAAEFAAGAQYTMPAKAVTLTAQWRAITVKYAITYDLNGASGDAPTQADAAEGDKITLAAAPSRDGYNFLGWKCSIDDEVLAAGVEYTMTAAATTFTAQWKEISYHLYSLTGEIGEAEVHTATTTVGEKLVMSDTKGRIKLTPDAGETFKAGDKISISGFVGNTSKLFGIIVYASNNSTKLAEIEVAGNSAALVGEATLSADAEYILIARKDGTTTTLNTCEITREGIVAPTAAGLAYSESSITKKVDDAYTNTLTNENELVVAYSTSDATVATVTQEGQIVALKAGTTTITAYSGLQSKNGILYAAGSASYTLTVSETATSINNTDAAVQTVKVIRNGQLIIIRDGKEFNVLGAAVK